MRKKRKTVADRLPYLLFLLMFFFCFADLASVAAPTEDDFCRTVGSICSEEPACRVVGGTHMLVWRTAEAKKLVVICVHGLGLCARAYKPLADEFSRHGIDGYAINVRGFGPDRSEKERSKLNLLETVKDIGSLIEGIKKEHPDYRVVVLGESMGAAISIRVAATYPQFVDALVCSAPAWKLFKTKSTAAKGIVDLVFYPGDRLGPASLAVVKMASSHDDLHRHLLQDPAHKLKLGAGEAGAFLGFVRKTDYYAAKLTCPVLMIQGLNDSLVDSRSVAKLFRGLSSDRKKIVIDAKAEHLILEEGQYSKPVLVNVINWVLDPTEDQEKNVELVNTPDSLNPQEIRRLAEIYRPLTEP